MKKLALFSLILGCCLWTTAVRAQDKNLDIPDAYTYSLDSLAFYIDSHCNEDTTKLRALYDWMVGHMHYNVYPTFVSVNQKRDEAKEIALALRSREGVCRHFARIFQEVSERMAIPAFFIKGYTKSNGAIIPDPHAWCAALVNGKWYLYDPTYGMGYVRNYKFVSSPNSNYCQVEPDKFISSHMPFDPIWQLLERPYTFQAFDQGLEPPADRPPFSYADSIRVHLQRKPVEQLTAVNERIRRNGTPNRLVSYCLEVNTANIAVRRHNEVYEIYKTALTHYNSCVDHYNALVRYRRTHDKVSRSDHRQVSEWIADAAADIAEASQTLQTADQVPEQYATAIDNLKTAIAELTEKVERKKEEML